MEAHDAAGTSPCTPAVGVLGAVPTLLRTLVKWANVGSHRASKYSIQPVLARVLLHLQLSETPFEDSEQLGPYALWFLLLAAIAVFWTGRLRQKGSNRRDPSLVQRAIDAVLRALGKRPATPAAAQPMPPLRSRAGTAGSSGTPLGVVSSSMRTLRRSGGCTRMAICSPSTWRSRRFPISGR